jgi:hypothetical protein
MRVSLPTASQVDDAPLEPMPTIVAWCRATLCATSPELLPISYVPCSLGELGPHRRGLQRKALRAPSEKKFELSHFRRAVGIWHRAHADQTR